MLRLPAILALLLAALWALSAPTLAQEAEEPAAPRDQPGQYEGGYGRSGGFLWFRSRSDRLPPFEQERRAAPLMEEAAQLEARGRLSSAASAYRRLAKKYPSTTHAPNALYAAARIDKERKKYQRAFDSLQNLIRRYPQFPRFFEVVRTQFEMAEILEQRVSRFLFIFKFNKWDRAILFYETVVANAPYSDLAPQALMRVADLHGRKRDRDAAIDALDRFINNYPNSLLASDAYMRLANTFAALIEGPRYDQDSTREAISYYRDYLILFPSGSEVAEAETGLAKTLEVFARSKLILGEYYYRFRKNYQAARVFFNQTITEAPDSPSAAKAREYLARIDSLPPPQPRAERAPKAPRQSFWRFLWPFGRKAKPTDVEQPLAPSTTDTGDRPSVTDDALQGANPNEARRGVGRLLGRPEEAPAAPGGTVNPPSEPEPAPEPAPTP